jgi:hypothetical protein
VVVVLVPAHSARRWTESLVVVLVVVVPAHHAVPCENMIAGTVYLLQRSRCLPSCVWYWRVYLFYSASKLTLDSLRILF